MTPREAIEFAAERHKGQMYGNQPYTERLESGHNLVEDALDFHETPLKKYIQDIRAAVYLHAIYEDTLTTRQEVWDRFGPMVELIVWTVTTMSLCEHPTPPRPDRQERMDKLTYRFQQARMATETGIYSESARLGAPVEALLACAQLVKLGDRIADVQHCWWTKDRRLFMYEKEHPEFRALFTGKDKEDPAIKALAGQLDELLGRKV